MAHSSRHNVLGSMEVFVHMCVCVCVCTSVCMHVCVCMLLHACACVVIKLRTWSPVGCGGQTHCSYLLTVILNHDIDAVSTVFQLALYVRIGHCTHPGGTIAITTTGTGSHVRTCTSCRVVGEWWLVHMCTTELKRRMPTVLDKCTVLTCNNMTTLYFIKQQDLLVEI